MKVQVQISQTQREVTEFFAWIGIIASSLSLLIIAAALGG